MNYKERLEALEAALPFFLASAWDEGFKAAEDADPATHTNPYRSKTAFETARDDLIDEME